VVWSFKDRKDEVVMNNKICKMISERIIAQLEKGIIPWRKPWAVGDDLAVSHTTGKPYSLLNQFLLGEPGEYITFKQAAAEGGSVRKGEKGRMVAFWHRVEKEVEDEDGEMKKTFYPMLKYYTVFHVNQCDGIEIKHYKEPETKKHDVIKEAEEIVDFYKEKQDQLKIINEKLSNEAYYSITGDFIKVPMMEQYEDGEEYYSTLFHEMGHSTGHSSRLNRFVKGCGNTFGSKGYAREELIAEITASVL